MREVPLGRRGLPLATESFLACVATVLELPLAEVPVPAAGEDPAAGGTVTRWLGRLGLSLARVADPASFSWPGPWIARIAAASPAPSAPGSTAGSVAVSPAPPACSPAAAPGLLPRGRPRQLPRGRPRQLPRGRPRQLPRRHPQPPGRVTVRGHVWRALGDRLGSGPTSVGPGSAPRARRRAARGLSDRARRRRARPPAAAAGPVSDGDRGGDRDRRRGGRAGAGAE